MTPEQQIRADKALTLAKLRFPGSDSLQLHMVMVEMMHLPEADLDAFIREEKMKRTLEVGCIVTHNGIGECVNDWSTVTPTKGHQGLATMITKEYVWVAFTGYEGRCQAADLTVVMSPAEAKAAQLPPGIPLELTPQRLLPSDDPRVILLTSAINTICECFPTATSWDGWQLVENGGSCSSL